MRRALAIAFACALSCAIGFRWGYAYLATKLVKAMLPLMHHK